MIVKHVSDLSEWRKFRGVYVE